MVVFVADCRPWMVLDGPFSSFAQMGLENTSLWHYTQFLVWGRHSLVKSSDYNKVC